MLQIDRPKELFCPIKNCMPPHLPARHGEMLALPFQIDPICTDKDLYQSLQLQDIEEKLAGPASKSI